jgi:hypothetical protein
MTRFYPTRLVFHVPHLAFLVFSRVCEGKTKFVVLHQSMVEWLEGVESADEALVKETCDGDQPNHDDYAESDDMDSIPVENTVRGGSPSTNESVALEPEPAWNPRYFSTRDSVDSLVTDNPTDIRGSNSNAAVRFRRDQLILRCAVIVSQVPVTWTVSSTRDGVLYFLSLIAVEYASVFHVRWQSCR